MFVGGVVGVPVLIYALAPRREENVEAWREIGELDEFPIGSVTPMELKWSDVEQRDMLSHGLFVWRRSVEVLVVYSRSCTDLGCPLSFDNGSHCYLCPCHGGIFNKYGNRLGGPPNRPMYRYRVRLQGAQVQVDVMSVPPLA